MSRRNKRGLLAAQPIFAIICRQLDAGTFPCSSLGFACAFVARRLHLLCYTLSPLSHVLLALRRDYTVVNKGSHQEQFARVVGRTCRVALRPKSSPRCGCRCGCGLPGFWKCRFHGLKSMMSALPPKADMCSALAHVRFGPIADIQCVPGPSRGSHTNTAVRGRITLISVNSPGCVSTSIAPACCLTMMSWLMERPRPVPSPVGLVVKNGSNIFSFTSGMMPVPLSRILISTRSPRFLVQAARVGS